MISQHIKGFTAHLTRG